MRTDLFTTFAGICAMAMLSGCSSDLPSSEVSKSPDEDNERRNIVLSRGEQ